MSGSISPLLAPYLASAGLSPLDTWSITAHADAGARATATRQGRARARHVLTGFVTTLSAGAAPGAAFTATVRILLGTLTIVEFHQSVITVAGANAPPLTLGGIQIAADYEQSITIEFLEVAAASIHQTVFACGYTEPIPPLLASARNR